MLQKPKGTMDLYGSDGENFVYLTNYLDKFMSFYNYKYIKTPMFEVSELFKRGVGETTDIVNKETYDFIDKGSREMTLRPELTAGTVRSLIENKLYTENTMLNKFYYIGSCFRYERPQSGRLREFTQFGVEVFGVSNPFVDAEVISVAYNFLNNIGIKNMKVKINTLGDSESRKLYRDALMKHLEKDISSLCETCQERYIKNPLRILDCKIDGESEVIKNAPKTVDYLTTESSEYFEKLKNILESLEIPYEVDTSLVRGLDYYTHTVFEIVSDLKDLGPASTICGGGRYDNLCETLGGPSIGGVGFALGIERLLKIIESEELTIPKNKVDVYIMNLSKDNFAYKLCDDLRNNGFITEIDYLDKNIKGKYKQVDKYNPTLIITVGDEEISNDIVKIKDNATKEEINIKLNDVIDYLNVNL